MGREVLLMHPKKYKEMVSWLTRKKPDINKHVVDTLNKYEDDSRVMYDPPSGTFKTENQLRKQFTAEDKIVQYDSATGLFSNKNKDVAFKDAVSARKHNEVYEKDIPQIQEIKASVKPIKKVKPFKKELKPFKKITQPFKIDPTPISSYTPLVIHDPVAEEQNRRFKNLQREIEEEKIKKNTSGLMSFAGIMK
jgi:hypothetical protein